MDAAAERTRILAALYRVYDFAAKCAADGPEYGDSESRTAFAVAVTLVSGSSPEPGESAEAWCDRVRELVREALKRNGSSAVSEAVAMIHPKP